MLLKVLLEVVSDNIEFQLFIVLFLGLVLGSFSTAIVYRTRQNQSWIWNIGHTDKTRSFCPSCRHTLQVKDLVPIVSWLLQKGRCRYCSVKIPLEYICLEISLVVLCFVVYGVFGFTKQGLLLMFMAPFFVSQGLLIVKYRVLSKLLLSIIIIGSVVVFLSTL